MDTLLGRRPQTVADYCEIKKYIMDADEELNKIGDKFLATEDLKMVMQKVPDKNQTKTREVLNMKNSAYQKKEEGMDIVERDDVKYKKKLDHEVPKLEE